MRVQKIHYEELLKNFLRSIKNQVALIKKIAAALKNEKEEQMKRPALKVFCIETESVLGQVFAENKASELERVTSRSAKKKRLLSPIKSKNCHS